MHTFVSYEYNFNYMSNIFSNYIFYELKFHKKFKFLMGTYKNESMYINHNRFSFMISIKNKR